MNIETIDREYHSLLIGICGKYFGNTGYTDDAYQETLIKVWEKYSTFDGSNLKAWLCTIAKHTCIDIIRKNRRHDHDTLDHAHNIDSSKMSDIERNEINSIIAHCISELTPRQETICKMRILQGMSLLEISIQLDVHIGTVKTLLHRSIAIMRVTLERENYR